MLGRQDLCLSNHYIYDKTLAKYFVSMGNNSRGHRRDGGIDGAWIWERLVSRRSIHAACDMLSSKSEGNLSSCNGRSADWFRVRKHFRNARLPGVQGQEGHPVPLDVPGVRIIHHHLRVHAFYGGLDGVAVGLLALRICESHLRSGVSCNRDCTVSARAEYFRFDQVGEGLGRTSSKAGSSQHRVGGVCILGLT